MSIFDLEHIFIVFHPGAGGNFIASLIDRIINNNYDSIVIGSSGAAHTTNNKKIEGVDYLSFGTEVYEQSEFESPESRIDFYVDKIKTEYSHVTTPQIIWTHDFTNIELYKKYFPNSKILVITQESIEEKTAVVLFNVAKNILDENTINPLRPKRMSEVMMQWNFVVNKELVKLLGESKAQTVEKNSPVYRYVSFSKMMQYYMLGKDMSTDVVNKVLYHVADNRFPYRIGKSYENYTTDCVKLPYKYIMDDDCDLLIDRLSKIISLNQDRIDFIVRNYGTYRKSQNQEILTDPIKYYSKLKQEAMQE